MIKVGDIVVPTEGWGSNRDTIKEAKVTWVDDLILDGVEYFITTEGGKSYLVYDWEIKLK